MAAPTLATIGTQGYVSVGSVSVPVPSGVASGTLVIVSLFTAYNTTTVRASTDITPPSGFAICGTSGAAIFGAAYGLQTFWYKYATGSDTGTYTFATTTTNEGFGGYAFTVTGGPSSGAPNVDTIEDVWETSSNNANVGPFTPTAGNTLLVANCWGGGTFTAPSGWTISAQGTDADSDQLGVMFLQQTTAASLTPTFTDTGGYLGITVLSIRTPSGTSWTGSPSDAVGITDSASAFITGSGGGTNYTANLNDAVGITDTGLNQEIDFFTSPSDAVGVTDSASAVQGVARTLNESVGITDSATPVQGIVRTFNDAVGGTDSASGTISGGGSEAGNPSESVGLTDSITTTMTVFREQDDAVGITDSATYILITPGSPQVFDPVGISDSVAYVFVAGPSDQYLYTPPQWKNVGFLDGRGWRGALRWGQPTSTLVYRINGTWFNQQDQGVDAPDDLACDVVDGLLLFFTRPTVVPASLHDELLALAPADASWSAGTLTPL